jgi:hypothetical protein
MNRERCDVVMLGYDKNCDAVVCLLWQRDYSVSRESRNRARTERLTQDQGLGESNALGNPSELIKRQA